MNQTIDQGILLDVQGVWKVYCRNLKRSMWYGIQEVGRQLICGGKDRRVEDLRPGEFFAVRDASFQIRQGECVAMLGPNGAGKSTMLKMINGLLRPDRGDIRINGRVGALIELGTGFNPILSGRENVFINGSVLGMKREEVLNVFDDIIQFAELGQVIDDPVKTYSSGMKVRLGFSVAAHLRPDILLMDEVLAVGDVGFRMKCFEHLNKLTKEGVSIVLVTHAVGVLPRVATRAIVFGKGKIVHDGDLETGSTIYEQSLGVHERGVANPKDEQERKTKIGTTVLLDSDGGVRAEFATDEKLELQIDLETTEPIKDARVVVALASPVHGVLASMSTPYQDVTFDLEPPGRTIKLNLPSLPFLVGAYHFNVSLLGSGKSDFYHRAMMRSPFRIVAPATDAYGYGINGIIKLKHDWKV